MCRKWRGRKIGRRRAERMLGVAIGMKKAAA
jgi:hypothetical protein